MDPNVIQFGDFELDLARFELRKAGKLVPVEPQAFDLMAYLARNSERTVSRDKILAETEDITTALSKNRWLAVTYCGIGDSR